MRILLLNDRIPPENRGGAGRVAWLLAGSLRDAGHEVYVIAATRGAYFEATRDGIPTYHIPARYPERFAAYFSLYNPQTVPHLRRLYRQIRPDVVNAHNIHADLSYYSLTLAQRMGIPAVFSSHDMMPFAYTKIDYFVDPSHRADFVPQYRLPPWHNLRQMRLRYNPLRNIVIRYILSHHAQMRVAVSQAHRQALEANDLPPFTVVYNGLDPNAFQADDSVVERLRTRLDLAGKRVILFAGRLTREKGSAQLLMALANSVQDVPQTMLLLLADRGVDWGTASGPAYDALRAQHVRAAGWLENDDLTAAYHLADMVAVPSIIMDCFPTVNLEAMAAAKPVIATCYGGSPEVVADGETGYIVNPFDTATFAQRLQSLLLDADLRQRMGNAGRQRLDDHFTLAQQVDAVLAVYHRAIAMFAEVR